MTFFRFDCFPACGKLPCGKLFHGNGWENDGCFPAVGGFNLLGGVGGDGNEFVWELSSGVIGLFKRWKEGLEAKASDGVEDAEAWVF